MAAPLSHPRKRRTREHVLESVSLNYVERFVFESGYTVERITWDYGYDLALFTYDSEGFAELGNTFIQVKSTDSVVLSDSGQYVDFRLQIGDYNKWRHEPMPVFLIVYDAKKRLANWLYVQQYFEEQPAREPRGNVRSVLVHIPRHQRWGRAAVS